MDTRGTEEFLERRLRHLDEARERLGFQQRRLREEIEAVEAEDFGLRRALAALRGEDVSAIRWGRAASAARALEAGRKAAMREHELARERARRDALERSQRAHDADRVAQATSLPPSGSTPPPKAVGDETAMRHEKRSDAIVRILTEIDRPLDRREILSRLVASGRPDESLDNISATLSHLRRTKKVVSVDGGWITPAALDRARQETTPSSESESEGIDEADGGDAAE